MKTKILTAVFILLFISFNIFGKESVKTQKIEIKKLLKIGPMQMTNLEKRLFKSDRESANFRYLDERFQKPEEGDTIEWKSGDTHKWNKVSTMKVLGKSNSISYFAVYLDIYKRLDAELLLENIGDLLIDLYLDGIPLKKIFNSNERSVKSSLKLLNEKHILLLKVYSPSVKKNIPKLYITIPGNEKSGILKLSLKLDRRVNFRNILNMISVRRVNVSPGGKYTALNLGKTDRSGKSLRWTEVIDTFSGKTVLNTEFLGNIRNFKWTGSQGIFSFSVTKKNKTSLHTFNMNTMKTGLLVEEVSGMSEYEWSPDNSFLIISKYKKRDLGKSYKYIRDIPDRSAYDKYEYSLEIYYPKGGLKHKISDTKDNFSGFMISPDSKRLLLIKDIPDVKNRPYFKSEFYILNIKSFSMKKLFASNFVRPVSWSPDSGKILFSGGPSSFEEIGKSPDMPKDIVPNEYDSQLFIYDIRSGKTDAITRTFDPSVQKAYWNIRDGNIYFKAEDRSTAKLFRYNIRKKKFYKYRTPGDVIATMDIANKGSFAVFWASGTTSPHKLYKLDLRRGNFRLLRNFNWKDFSRVKFGKVEDWNFRKDTKKEIIGRIYYPVNFSAEKKYPCIVYYYGGTSPVERSFGGRYPFNWYAANGYIVYVLQPSGATGFGQKFSSVHVNDWGKTTSREIISAVKQLLKTHSFIDPKRVGAMGASYGGFLTQYIATQTDLFAAFISHAGISALSSYWGVGDWGYTYSGIATANSFPWNRKDLYVGHSPLFMADRIKDPILLLHGDADNNVPPGESYQMFLALKLLGKEVALVTFGGQAHWILEYGKRIRWMKTIIAWFDKWLKKEPLYWNSLYGKYEK